MEINNKVEQPVTSGRKQSRNVIDQNSIFLFKFRHAAFQNEVSQGKTGLLME